MLWVYDFQEDRFSTVSSKSLLTTETPWHEGIEGFLNKYLETPLSGFLTRFNKTRDGSDINQEELRALKLAVVLQVPRSSKDAVELGELVDKGEPHLNDLTMALDEVYSFVHVPLRQECLCFPDHGIITVPFLGASPGLGIALHPSYLVVAVPNPPEKFIGQIERYRESKLNVFSYLSVGLDTCVRVVIPASARGKNDEDTIRAGLSLARESGKNLVQTMLAENRALLGTALPTPSMLAARSRPY